MRRSSVAGAVIAVLAADPSASSAAPAPSERMARAYRLMLERRPADAIAVFKSVLRYDPGNTEANTELARLYARLGRHDEAARFLERASLQDPGNAGLLMELGRARAALDDSAGAAEAFRAVARAEGPYRGQAELALAELDEGAAPPETVHRKTVGEGWIALRRGDRATARRKFEEALASTPRDAELLKQLGFLDIYDGRIPEAVARLETVRSLDEDDHFVALQLGYLYRRLERRKEAREAFSAALASPDEKIRSAALEALGGSGPPL